MKTEFLENLIPSTVEGRGEIIKQIFAENGKDVNAAKGDVEKLKNDLTAANEQLTTARNTIVELEKSKGSVTDLEAKLKAYEDAEKVRKDKEASDAARKEVESRFDAAFGTERKFVHELVRPGVVGEFEKALADPANKGKSDKDVFDAITKDKDYFASQNPPAGGGMGGMGGGSGADKIDARAVMGLPPLDAAKK